MIKTSLPTFSGDTVNFTLPESWSDFTQEQLYYAFFALAHFEGISAKIHIFIRLTGIEVISSVASIWFCRTRDESGKAKVFTLRLWQITACVEQFAFLDSVASTPVRLDTVQGIRAVDAELHGVPFRTYLVLENLYQGFLATQNEAMLQEMARLLYMGSPEFEFDETELLSVMMWYSSVKNLFARKFTHFFRKTGSALTDGDTRTQMEEVMNSEIRALTGGDITKEATVLSMDVWRALTELNEKSREAQEFNRKYGKH